ncbi:MAG: hypothetical protein U9R15_14175, partial [Chloroflexota bacterium]|nr:hypothetical protein [Chloroflexota bacterium]
MGMISGSRIYDDTLTMSSAESHLDKNLENSLNYVRSQLKAIAGETNWYDTPGVTLATVSNQEQGLSGSLANIYEFTGMDNRNDTTPTYSSNNYVTDDDNLELAIGDLDAQVKANYDGYTGLTLDNVCDVTVPSTTDQSIIVGGLDAGSGLIQTTGKIQASSGSASEIIKGGSLTVNGDADIEGDLNVGGTITVNNITLVHTDIYTTGELGISGSSVLGNDEDVDTTTIVGDLRLHNRLYVNYNGAPGDDYIY